MCALGEGSEKVIVGNVKWKSVPYGCGLHLVGCLA